MGYTRANYKATLHILYISVQYLHLFNFQLEHLYLSGKFNMLNDNIYISLHLYSPSIWLSYYRMLCYKIKQWWARTRVSLVLFYLINMRHGTIVKWWCTHNTHIDPENGDIVSKKLTFHGLLEKKRSIVRWEPWLKPMMMCLHFGFWTSVAPQFPLIVWNLL